MENPTEVKEDERSCDVAKPVEAVETVIKVENKEEVKTDRPTPTTKSSGRKRSQERERDRSRDRQTVRERHRRGERSRGGERPAPKGSIYRPRSRPECRVHISNIPYEYRWQDLKDLFRNEVGEVSFVELFEDEHGKPRGCGVVEFEKLEHARIALDKMNRFELKGRHLVVKEDIDIERDGYGRLVGAGNSQISGRDEMPPPHSSGREYAGDNLGHGGGMRYGSNIGTLASPSSTRWSNTYGLSPQFLDSLGISGPLFHRIFVANLDYKVDDAKLREVFRLAGKVVVAEVVKDRDGRSRGFGVVEMSHPIEAVQAISMFNNQMLFDRRMTVRMDRDAERIETTRSSRLPEGLRSIGMGLGTGGNPLHDVPRGGIMALPSERHSDSYRNSSDLSFGNRVRGGGVDITSADMGMSSSMESNFSSMSGVPAGMGGPMERSLSGLHTMGASQSMHSLSMNDYRRNTLETDYNVPSGGVGNNGSLNGGAGNSSSTAYGYTTENLSARGSTLSSVPDYERRDAYAGYRTNQSTRERQDYLPVSTGYDTGNRMSSVGTIQSSVVVGAGVDSSRLSDTIVVTNLPPNCTWQDLRDKFCEVGDVLFADIRAKGTGVVRFSSERDAQRACSMLNRTRMDSHTIEVEFY